MKKIRLIVLLCIMFFALQELVACSPRSTPVAYLPHVDQSQQNGSISDTVTHSNNNFASNSSTMLRKTIYLESHKELNEYTGFIYQELLVPVTNVFLENNFIVITEREKADFIAVLDFGVEGKKKITKMTCTPHYEKYPAYRSLYGGFGSWYGYHDWGMGAELSRTGIDCFSKEYYVFPHSLKVSCYKNTIDPVRVGSLQFAVELVYHSLQNDYRSSIQKLIARFSSQLRDAVLWNNTVYIEFDFLPQ